MRTIHTFRANAERDLHAKKFSTDQKAMIAARLRPYYAAQAKIRMEAGENQHTKRPEEKIPQARRSQSRDEAGKAAGIISEASKKNIIHSRKAPVCHPPVSPIN